MATSTLPSPEEAPTSTSTAISTFFSTSLTKIIDFFHSILLLLLHILRRALQSVSNRIRRPNSATTTTTLPSSTHPNTTTAAPTSASASGAMTTINGPPNRLQPPKVLPALPLIAPKRASPEKDSKENDAPPRKEAGSLPRCQAQPQDYERQAEPNEKLLSQQLDQLDLGDDVNDDTVNAEDGAVSNPSSTSRTNSLPVFIPCPPLPIPEPLTGERAIHSGFMREALDMARLALVTNETPVGCVLVYHGKVIAKGMNATNITRNGTRHAELMAISALLSYSAPPTKPAPDAPASESRRRKRAKRRAHANKNNDETTPAATEEEKWGDIDPKDGHLYPYGQKLHPAPKVDKSVIAECVLYVTVEPCVMCASLLRQLRIRKVYFGAVNDKFGGTGGVFRIHMNAGETIPETAPMASAPPSPRLSATNGMARPSLEPRAMSCAGQVDGDSSVNGNKDTGIQIPKRAPTEQLYMGGHGGNVEPGYEAEGGWGRDEAVTLLRQFYVQENGRAPIPRKKEGRAARLALMLERDGHAGGPMIPALPDDEETAPPSDASDASNASFTEDTVSPMDIDEA